MGKSKTSKPKYAPNRNAARTANHSSSETREAAERQRRQAPDQGAEGEQRASMMKDHNCCYYNCPEPGTIHIGPNGGDSHWICWVHYYKWQAQRARFLADGGGCAMEELGELLEASNSLLVPA